MELECDGAAVRFHCFCFQRAMFWLIKIIYLYDFMKTFDSFPCSNCSLWVSFALIWQPAGDSIHHHKRNKNSIKWFKAQCVCCLFFSFFILLILHVSRNSRAVGAAEENTTQIIIIIKLCVVDDNLSFTILFILQHSYATPFTLLKILFESVLEWPEWV